MNKIATIKSGEIWASGRSCSIYIDIDTSEGYVPVRLDEDGTWHADTRELDDRKEGTTKTLTLRQVIELQAAARGERGGLTALTKRTRGA